ncbi:MAG: Ppx/GppA phosphatase family protein [Kineosporiaceae bacterium]
MTRVAAVDCGTNSLRLLIAEVDSAAGTLVDLERRMEIVRLGQGVDRTGRFHPEALRRTLDVTAEYAAACTAQRIERIRFVATSASRDAANRDAFVDGVRERLGVEPEVITGQEEAHLSFVGATRGLSVVPEGEVLVVDIGGGSTEVVLGVAGGQVQAARSVDVGCVRLLERHGDGPDGVRAARVDIEAALDDVERTVPVARARALVGLAGTITTVTAHALRLTAYDASRIHGASLPLAQAMAACDELITMSRERRAALPYLHPGRVDVIGAGALLWRCIMRRAGEAAGITEAVTSEHDILDGIAWSIA